MAYLLPILTLVQSLTLVEYKLWKNYGQLVYDYSQNTLHGVNGKKQSKDKFDGVFTDRGFYLNESTGLCIPQSKVDGTVFLISGSFTVILWAYSDGSVEMGRLFCRWRPLAYILLYRDKTSQKIILTFFDTRVELGFNDTWLASNFYLDRWFLVSLEVDKNKFIVRLDYSEFPYTFTQDYIETELMVATFIGTDTTQNNGFGGFVAYFAIINNIDIFRNYLSGQSSNCLINECTNCTISYKIPNLGTGCGPVSNQLDGYLNFCSESNPCYASLKMNCDCSTDSCVTEDPKKCHCINLSTGTSEITECDCTSGSTGQGCCLDECSSCLIENICLACVGDNLIVGSDGRCKCMPGYYTEGDISTNPCELCMDECSECINGSGCTQCKDSNLTSINGKCVCKDGYFNSSLINGEQCSPCDSKCALCDDIQTCKKCNSDFETLENGLCGCKQGYWLDPDKNYCKACDTTCRTCNNTYECLTCETPQYELINETKCLLTCGKNMERIQESCICEYGFVLSVGNCIESKFSMHLSVSKSNKLKLNFEEVLNQTLVKSDLILKISDSINFEYNLTEIQKKVYLVTFVFQESVPNNTEFSLEFKEPVISYNGSKLESSEYAGYLFEYIYITPVLKSLYEKTKAVSNSLSSFSLLSSIVSNPAASWGILSTLQIIPYIPIVKSETSTNIEKFCLSIGNYNVIPNVMEYVFESSSASEPSEEAKKIGFTSSLFFINSGQIVVIFIANILLWPILKFFSLISLGVMTLKFKKLLRNYKYSFFIRFWIQSSLDVGFFAIIQLKSVFSI